MPGADCQDLSGGRTSVGPEGSRILIPTFGKTMETKPQELMEVVYRGVWQGLGKIYNIKVGKGYTTIIVKKGEDVKQRYIETVEKFASRQ